MNNRSIVFGPIRLDTDECRFSYVLNKIQDAIRHLTIGKGDVRQRLYEAFISDLHAVHIRDLPKELKPLWKDIRHRLTRMSARHEEGNLRATLDRMRNTTGSKIAQDLCILRDKLRTAISHLS